MCHRPKAFVVCVFFLFTTVWKSLDHSCTISESSRTDPRLNIPVIDPSLPPLRRIGHPYGPISILATGPLTAIACFRWGHDSHDMCRPSFRSEYPPHSIVSSSKTLSMHSATTSVLHHHDGVVPSLKGLYHHRCAENSYACRTTISLQRHHPW